MNQPYQIVLDLWEANTDVDVETLKENGVTGLIVRLNDMVGGHHLDEHFEQNWAKALLFSVQTLYFVYNPWVDGKANCDWLIAHLPANFGKRRILVDVEVKYAGYSPTTYAKELQKFIALVKAAGYQIAIYTGAWFLSVVSSWPTQEDYWWGAYPYVLTNSKTWEEYKQALSTVSYSSFTKASPGPAKIWQCTGDGVRLAGFGNHAVDVSVFPGTLEDLAGWLSVPDGNPEEPQPVEEPEPVSGLYMVAQRFVNKRERPSEYNSRDIGDVLPGERVGPIIGIEGGATGAWAKLAQNEYVCVADRYGTTYLVEP